jgi:hypothetical protein
VRFSSFSVKQATRGEHFSWSKVLVRRPGGFRIRYAIKLSLLASKKCQNTRIDPHGGFRGSHGTTVFGGTMRYAFSTLELAGA